MNSPRADVKVILFDLGGILVELNKPSGLTSWFNPNLSEAENWRLWLTSPFTQAFERGEISPPEFAARFIEENKIEVGVNSFLTQFRDWVVGFYPGVFPMLSQLSQTYTLGIFSNITEVHWPELHHKMLMHGAISHYFASYQIGMVKPDPSAFLHVAREIGVTPNSILFVDDNMINVEGARSAGYIADVVKDFDALPAVLRNHGLIPQVQGRTWD